MNFEMNKYNANMYIVLENIKDQQIFFQLLHSCCTDRKYTLTYKGQIEAEIFLIPIVIFQI